MRGIIPPGGIAAQSPPTDPTARADARVDWRPMDPSTPFAHASEAEMARILDFYAVRWVYEPETFPILWNLEGVVVESFSPDFYLPEFDTYLELTTLRQPLVRKKNRKLRRLRELYPDIRIKLLYARDFRALMLKYGKLGLVDALSGTPGQAPPSRVRSVPGPAEPVTPPTSAPTADEPAPVPAGDVSPAPAAGDESLEAEPRRPRRRRRRASIAASPLTVMTGPDA